MSLDVVDTDILTLLRRGDPAVVRQAVAHLHDELVTTVITAEETVVGWLSCIRSANRPDQLARGYQELADSISFLATWALLPYRESTIALFDQLRAMKLNVRTMDLRIAAIVLENNATLVTRNLRDFQRIPGLAIENWAV